MHALAWLLAGLAACAHGAHAGGREDPAQGPGLVAVLSANTHTHTHNDNTTDRKLSASCTGSTGNCKANCYGGTCDEWDSQYGVVEGQCDWYYQYPDDDIYDECDCSGCECDASCEASTMDCPHTCYGQTW